MNDMRKLMETASVLDEEYSSIANDEIERHIEEAGKALAKEAVQQAAGVWDDEGDGEGRFRTGARNGREYVRMAAPKFFDEEYKATIMAELDKHFNEYVEYFIEYVDAGADPDWDNME